MVFIINDQHTWARAVDSNLYKHWLIFYHKQWWQYVGRTLVIKCVYDHDQYSKGKTWHIPEHEFDRALAVLRKKNPHIKSRLSRGAHKLLPCDVEAIVELATYGNVKLHLKAFVNQSLFY